MKDRMSGHRSRTEEYGGEYKKKCKRHRERSAEGAPRPRIDSKENEHRKSSHHRHRGHSQREDRARRRSRSRSPSVEVTRDRVECIEVRSDDEGRTSGKSSRVKQERESPRERVRESRRDERSGPSRERRNYHRNDGEGGGGGGGGGRGGSPWRGRRHIKRERSPSPPKEECPWGTEEEKKKKPVVNIAKPDFGLSGKLAEETNIFNGVVIKYSEPPEARKPKTRWRLYPFKGNTALPVLHMHRQSAYLIGRDRKIADFPIDHPSCSKQHAVLQYRVVPYSRADGSTGRRVRPYIIDLESANGTFVNNVKIQPRCYVELLEKDVVKFGFSSREYVVLHDQSRDDLDSDDNVPEAEEEVPADPESTSPTN